MDIEPLDADAVLALARQQGQAWVDAEVAARIAAGAASGVDAVRIARASVPLQGLVTDDPESFLSVLESLSAEATR